MKHSGSIFDRHSLKHGCVQWHLVLHRKTLSTSKKNVTATEKERKVNNQSENLHMAGVAGIQVPPPAKCEGALPSFSPADWPALPRRPIGPLAPVGPPAPYPLQPAISAPSPDGKGTPMPSCVNEVHVKRLTPTQHSKGDAKYTPPCTVSWAAGKWERPVVAVGQEERSCAVCIRAR